MKFALREVEPREGSPYLVLCDATTGEVIDGQVGIEIKAHVGEPMQAIVTIQVINPRIWKTCG